MTKKNKQIIIVMGASGVGKTTIASQLARQLSWRFVDADDFHSLEAIERMRDGLALNDSFRLPWIDRIIKELGTSPHSTVLAWSGLRFAHRELFRDRLRQCRFVHLVGTSTLLRNRLLARENHFMPASQIEDQLQTLEPTDHESDVLEISADDSVTRIQQHILKWLETNHHD